MLLPLLHTSRRYVLIDIDTQRDFLLTESDPWPRNRRKILANIRRLMAWARHESIPIISTARVCRDKRHATIDQGTNGIKGQTKMRYTLRSNRAFLSADDTNYFPADLLQVHKQVILQKRCTDPFDEPRLDRLLSEVQADELILMGGSTEGAVKATALGLLQRGKNVRVVVDALGSHNRRDAELALQMMQLRGAKLTVTKELAGISHLRKVGVCNRRRADDGLTNERTQLSRTRLETHSTTD